MGEMIKKYNWWLALIVPLFVVASFFVAQVVLGLVIVVLSKLGVDFKAVDDVTAILTEYNRRSRRFGE